MTGFGMTRRVIAALMLGALAACVTGIAQPSDPATRKIDAGLVHGLVEDGSVSFRGIPYAAPPLGEIRWAPPMPVKPWSGVKDSSAFGPICPQKGAAAGRAMSEDCLTLNVSIPETPHQAGRLPVLVRIHGGGFVTGNGPSGHSARVWNRQDIILVTMNYRLGALGYFAHPALRGKDQLPANYGLLDIKAALEWVHRNISAFGGDPSRVTITGVSAGAEAVQLLLVMPGTEGLFSGAIASSGYADWPLPRVGKDAEALAVAAAAKAAGTDAPLNPGQLLEIPPEKLVNAVDGFVTPIVDGVTVLDQPMKQFAAGKGARVPVMTGGNSYEGTVYASSGATEAQVMAMLGADKDKVVALYADDFAVSHNLGLTRLFGDMRYVLSCALVAGEQSRKTKAWLYYVSYVPPDRRATLAGSPHGGETPLLENGGPEGPGPAMQTYWVNFIRTGDPNGAGLAKWPAADARHSQWITFGDQIGSGDVLRMKLEAIAKAMGLVS